MKALSSSLLCFKEIIDAGSITAAAEKLGMSKSSVSQYLKNLEQELGVTLIARTTRRQSLTPVGQRYYQRCLELAKIAEDAESEITSYRSEPSGKLRITIPHIAVRDKIGPVLATVIDRYPSIEPVLIIDDRRLDLIEHSIDVSISIGNLADSNYRARRIGKLQDVLCVSISFLKAHKLNRKAIKDIGRIAYWPYIASVWQGSSISHDFYAVNNTIETLSFQASMLANTADAVRIMACQGLGLAYLPSLFIEREIASGELIVIDTAVQSEEKPIYAVHSHGNFLPPSVSLFIDEFKLALKIYDKA